MTLAVGGVVTALAGIALGVPGLVLAGGLWVALGLLTWVLVTRHEEVGTVPGGVASVGVGEARRKPSFALGVTMLLAVGVFSLLIGLLGIGFDEDRAWRWVPIGLGALVLAIVAVGGLVRRSGAAMVAAAEKMGEPTQIARVTIEAARETGTYVNHRPRLELDLLVEPQGSPSYRLTQRAIVPHTALGKIGVGGGFRARVVPGNEEHLAIEWDSPLADEVGLGGGQGEVATRPARSRPRSSGGG